jgi:hypothetical protein
MGQRSIRILLMISLFIGGCSTLQSIKSADQIPEDIRDVYVLTILAQDYLRKTGGRDFNLEKLIKYDSLGIISKKFEIIEQKSRGGHIAILYKFSQKRNYKIEVTEYEKQIKENLKLIEKKNIGNFDGEIQFEYGERFYNLKKIIVVKRNGSVSKKV